MASVISSFEKFCRTYEGKPFVESKNARLSALKDYFSFGGIISVSENGNEWPKLIYPSQEKIGADLQELQKLRENFSGKRGEWKHKLTEAKIYHTKHRIMKFSNALYWKHLLKCVRDKEYKKAADAVKLPAHLVNDKRWQQMIKTFLENAEYRENLATTVQNSVVYGKDRKVGKYADALNSFRAGISSKSMEKLNEKIMEIDRKISALKVLSKWAGE